MQPQVDKIQANLRLGWRQNFSTRFGPNEQDVTEREILRLVSECQLTLYVLPFSTKWETEHIWVSP